MKNIVTQIAGIPAAIRKNEFTPLQTAVCTIILVVVVFGGLLLLKPYVINS
jgi:hypothetical protein